MISKTIFLFVVVIGTFLVDAETISLRGISKDLLSHVHKVSPFKADQDWANLARYAKSNEILSKLPAGSNQVIFMGDSITDGWKLDQYFPGKPYVNRGISGQTTPQMLVRFRPDLINLKPNVTVILAGTNDIAGNTGHQPASFIEGNIMTMAEVARAHGIKVIIASLLPVCGSITQGRPPKEILKLNFFIQNYCERTGAIFLDYFSAMTGANGLLRPELTNDCLHPNAAGYNVMAPLAQAAINKALQS